MTEIEKIDEEIFELFGVRGAPESIAAAWQVVEKMGQIFGCQTMRDGVFCAYATFKGARHSNDSGLVCLGEATAPHGQMPRAICLAALAAVRASKGGK